MNEIVFLVDAYDLPALLAGHQPTQRNSRR
jgi:hypothetical protein